MPKHLNTGQALSVTKHHRQMLNGHRSYALWLTGLSGAGKSTLANALEAELYARGMRTFLLDGDNLRTGLTQDLGFSPADRRENVRRVAHAAKLLVDAGVVVLVALISPFHEERQRARALFAPDEFVEIFVDCPLDVCEARDVKGLYHQARIGKIPEFTGISSPYERPANPDIRVQSDRQSVESDVRQVLLDLSRRGLVPNSDRDAVTRI
ncbi:MAG: adenylyl-sulfate kinase [Thermaerobacter sp.]|nr:adenylyl-sulfate kinase [Thermaerobacter sp.]